jgi:hypothetical protein
MSTAGEDDGSGHRWTIPGMPHRGWEWLGVVDLNPDELPMDEVEYETCQACGMYPIRFVHTIRHDEWPDELDVGRICVEHLTEDYVSAHADRCEERLKRRAAAVRRKRKADEAGRARWAQRDWRESARGNFWTKEKGDRSTVFASGSGWRIVVDGIFGRRTYPSPEAAMQASYDALSWVKRTRARENEEAIA